MSIGNPITCTAHFCNDHGAWIAVVTGNITIHAYLCQRHQQEARQASADDIEQALDRCWRRRS